MKRPHQGIQSTCPKPPQTLPAILQPALQLTAPVLLLFKNAAPFPGPTYGAHIGHYPIDSALEESNPRDKLDLPLPVNIIANNESSTEGNSFCFGTFADKHTGTIYNDLTSNFPFMSLEGNVCFLVVYHYESNTILGLPIANMEDNTIFVAYKKQFEFLESKGHKIKLSIMDNQTSKQIKKSHDPGM
jgi:hypothetical protein